MKKGFQLIDDEEMYIPPSTKEDYKFKYQDKFVAPMEKTRDRPRLELDSSLLDVGIKDDEDDISCDKLLNEISKDAFIIDFEDS